MPRARDSEMTEYLIAMLYPPDDSIEQEDVLALLEELEKVGPTKGGTVINLLLNSSGGDIYSAYKMVRLLRSRCSKLRVIVPLYAKSAATLMALGSDEIIMAEQSELGPLDAPMEHPLVEGIHLSALDGIRPLEFLSEFCVHLVTDMLGIQIRTGVGLGRKDSIKLALDFAADFIRPVIGKLDPLVINMCYRRLQIAEKYGRLLLEEYMFKDESAGEDLADETIMELVWEYPAHGYAICSSEAKRINLKVVDASAYAEWDKLWKLYVELMKRGQKYIRLVPREEMDGLPQGGESKGEEDAKK